MFSGLDFRQDHYYRIFKNVETTYIVIMPLRYRYVGPTRQMPDVHRSVGLIKAKHDFLVSKYNRETNGTSE